MVSEVHEVRSHRQAAVFSREMVSALGIPIPRIFTWVFTLGISIAGLAGGIQSAIGSVTLGMDIAIIIQAFCVVVIGGFGSLVGTLVGALIVGEVFSFAILFWTDGAMVLIFAHHGVDPDRPAVGALWHPYEGITLSAKNVSLSRDSGCLRSSLAGRCRYCRSIVAEFWVHVFTEILILGLFAVSFNLSSGTWGSSASDRRPTTASAPTPPAF